MPSKRSRITRAWGREGQQGCVGWGSLGLSMPGFDGKVQGFLGHPRKPFTRSELPHRKENPGLGQRGTGAQSGVSL